MIFWWNNNSESSSSLYAGESGVVIVIIASIVLVGAISWALWDPLGDPESSVRRFFKKAFLLFVTFAITNLSLSFLTAGLVPSQLVPFAITSAIVSVVLFCTFFLGSKFLLKSRKRLIFVTTTIALTSLLTIESLFFAISWPSASAVVYVCVLAFITVIAALKVSRVARNHVKNTGNLVVEAASGYSVMFVGVVIGLLIQLAARFFSFDDFWQIATFWVANVVSFVAILLGFAANLSTAETETKSETAST